MTRADLQAALENANVEAWLQVIREGETNHDTSAYSLLNGGKSFSGFGDHPYAGQSAPPGLAAGAYQFIPHTWQALVKQYAFPDFSPHCQDEGAVALTAGRGALDYVKAGNLAGAMRLCREEWTSLQTMPMARAQAVWAGYGGSVPDSGTSVPNAGTYTIDPALKPVAPQPKVNQMPALLALLPVIAQFIPQLMTMLKPNSVSTAKDAQVVQTVMDTVVKAAGVVTDGASATAATVGAAIDRMQADPELVKTVQRAVVTEPSIMQILEIGGGIAAARELDQKTMAADKPFWQASAVFWISVLLLPLVYWLVGSLIVGGAVIPEQWPVWAQMPLKLFGGVWNGESRSGGFNLVIGLVLGGICGVYYGISVTQNKQQQTANSEK